MSHSQLMWYSILTYMVCVPYWCLTASWCGTPSSLTWYVSHTDVSQPADVVLHPRLHGMCPKLMSHSQLMWYSILTYMVCVPYWCLTASWCGTPSSLTWYVSHTDILQPADVVLHPHLHGMCPILMAHSQLMWYSILAFMVCVPNWWLTASLCGTPSSHSWYVSNTDGSQPADVVLHPHLHGMCPILMAHSQLMWYSILTYMVCVPYWCLTASWCGTPSSLTWYVYHTDILQPANVVLHPHLHAMCPILMAHSQLMWYSILTFMVCVPNWWLTAS